MSQNQVRIATEEDITRLLKHSASASPLAPTKRYPDLDLEAIPRAYRLDEVDIEIEEKELEGGSTLAFRQATPSVASPRSISRHAKAGRGVTHIRPGRIMVAAWTYLLTCLAVIGTLVGVPVWMALTHDQEPNLLMLAPVAFLLIMLILAVRWVPRSRCTVCMQPMFLNLSCLRNNRAHRFAFGNTALSSALVAIVSFRVRCPYCGTKQHMLGRRVGQDR